MKFSAPIHPAIMATTKQRPDDPGRERLTTRQNEQVRAIGKEVLRSRFDQNGTKMATAVGLTQPNLSRFLNGKQGTTQSAALRILALADIEPSVVGLDAPSSDVFPRKPVVSHLPGWAEAEREARRIYRRIPETAWLSARKFSTHLSPQVITADFVMHLALAADSLATVSEAEVEAMKEAKETARLEDEARGKRR